MAATSARKRTALEVMARCQLSQHTCMAERYSIILRVLLAYGTALEIDHSLTRHCLLAS